MAQTSFYSVSGSIPHTTGLWTHCPKFCLHLGPVGEEDGPREAHTSPENTFGVIWVKNSGNLLILGMEKMLLHEKV